MSVTRRTTDLQTVKKSSWGALYFYYINNFLKISAMRSLMAKSLKRNCELSFFSPELLKLIKIYLKKTLTHFFQYKVKYLRL